MEEERTKLDKDHGMMCVQQWLIENVGNRMLGRKAIFWHEGAR